MKFLLVRNRLTLRGADLLSNQASALAADGRYEEALPLFLEAARLDAFDPHRRFLAGLTCFIFAAMKKR